MALRDLIKEANELGILNVSAPGGVTEAILHDAISVAKEIDQYCNEHPEYGDDSTVLNELNEVEKLGILDIDVTGDQLSVEVIQNAIEATKQLNSRLDKKAIAEKLQKAGVASPRGNNSLDAYASTLAQGILKSLNRITMDAIKQDEATRDEAEEWEHIREL
jgi:hypothetical protein